jgi:ribonuclease P protein component
MLPINRRVKKESFAKIMTGGVFVHAPNFYLRLLDRKDAKPSLFGFVVPNKVIKTAVGRHLLKRKMTAVVEKLLITLKTGSSVVIFAKKDVSTLPYLEIEKEILELLKKAKILS